MIASCDEECTKRHSGLWLWPLRILAEQLDQDDEHSMSVVDRMVEINGSPLSRLNDLIKGANVLYEKLEKIIELGLTSDQDVRVDLDELSKPTIA